MLAHPDHIEALQDRIIELETLLGLRETLPLQAGLRPMERKILGILLSASPRVVSREFMVRATHNSGEPYDETIRAHISRIRRKLPHHSIQTVSGEGYYIPRVAKEELEQFYRNAAC